MKRCIACGMPMKDKSEYANNDVTKDYCIYCARADGSMQSFEEKKQSLINFYIKTQGIDHEAAIILVEANMRKLPAWKAYF